MELNEVARSLFTDKRYKVLYGGRGGGKSHDIAAALLIQGAQEKLFIVCAREIQKSIKDSVHRLLKNKIMEDDVLKVFYTVQNDKIVGANGTEFVFTGLKHNPDAVKSLEGADRCWVEEADNVSARSWEVLIPTIRKQGSQIWISFNPRYASDPTWQRFVLGADDDCFVQKVSWRDNAWFPDTLDKERRKLQAQDPTAYDHIWEGNFDERFIGAVYAKYLKEAREQGRITEVPYKVGAPVIAAWDLGYAHNTCIWFAQKVGEQVRIIDYYEASQEHLSHYAELMRSKPYDIVNYIPHDGRHERLGMEGSIKDQLRSMGLKVEDVPSMSKKAGMTLAQELLMTAKIDGEKCVDGIHALNSCEFEFDEKRNRPSERMKDDWFTDSADSLRYLAIALNSFEEEEEFVIPPPSMSRSGWVG